MKLFAVAAAAALLTFFPLHSQSLIVGTPTIIRANYSVVFNPQSTATPITALQFTFNFVPGQVTSVTPLPGSASVAAGKSVQCGTLNTTLGSLTCLVFGINTTPIGVGTVANFTSTVAENTLFTNIKITLTCLVASDQFGNAVPFPGAPPCHNLVESFNPDGVTTVFTLLNDPIPPTSVVVTINGVIQTNYTVDENMIIFMTPPPCPQPTCAAIMVSYTF